MDERKVRILDVFSRSGFPRETGGAVWKVECHLALSGLEDMPVKVRLYLEGEEDVLAAEARLVLSPDKKQKVYLEHVVAAPRLWTVEDPVLHPVRLEVSDHMDRPLVDKTFVHGFRQVEILDTEIRCNGRSIRLHGIRMDNATRGRADSLLPLCKRLGVDTVVADARTGKEIAGLCDRLGLWLLPLVQEEGDVKALRSHPCVLAYHGVGSGREALWSLDNTRLFFAEGWGDLDPYGELAMDAQELDPEREPAKQELFHRFQKLRVEPGEGLVGRRFEVQVTNGYVWTDLSAFEGRYAWLEDGVLLEEGALELPDAGPGETVRVSHGLPSPPLDPAKEYHVNYRLYRRSAPEEENRELAGAFQLLAAERGGALEDRNQVREAVSAWEELALADRQNTIEILAETFFLEISKKTGDITSLLYDHKEHLQEPHRLQMPRGGEAREVKVCGTENHGHRATIELERKYRGCAKGVKTTYTVHTDGSVSVRHGGVLKDPKDRVLARIRFHQPMRALEYFGRQPQAGPELSIQREDPKEMAEVREKRTQVRWVAAIGWDAQGMRLEALEGRSMEVETEADDTVLVGQEQGRDPATGAWEMAYRISKI
ncbi:DUF4981 domain-containing protein [Anaerotalea alkaliphila]|uniref:beta-galactosidase n=1 Tax=Anaerotalea alkaliphila TaxID=2662126 RepID=A0A7X5HV52_9FIRM|nr:DUF4981 domain-containing protein [Anaerotalea alkaliphila]NDL67221.1 hypothetical protein [Anaerotalea alkaliphila]